MTQLRSLRSAAITALAIGAAMVFALTGDTVAQPGDQGSEPCALKGAAGPTLLADGESALLSYQNLTDHTLEVNLKILDGGGEILAASDDHLNVDAPRGSLFVDLPPGETSTLLVDSTQLPAVQVPGIVTGVLEVISEHGAAEGPGGGPHAQGPQPCLTCPKGLGMRLPGTGSLQLVDTAQGTVKGVVPCNFLRGSFVPQEAGAISPSD